GTVSPLFFGVAHCYLFKLYALDTKFDLKPATRPKYIHKLIKDHILDSAQLIGLYKRE
ncbi:unnamed protein product, partial [marine sediment metagenome]